MRTTTRTLGVICLLMIVTVTSAFAARKKPPKPNDRTQIQHIVVVMMENRSFDHLLGWHPAADGMQAGLSYPDDAGVLHPTHPLAPDFTGCGHPDPDHSWGGGREEYNLGAMDGFRRAGANDDFAIGYYEEDDRPFLAAFARSFTTLDRSFSSILGPTYPNRIFLHAAQTDRLDNVNSLTSLPTIWDRLESAHVSAKYYVSDLSFLALWGTRYLSITSTYSQFLADAAAGTLPQVAFVEPPFLGEELGICSDDHPYCDVRRGDAFLARTYEAIASNLPLWRGTVLVVTYDEWGGFFDHVPPPRAAAPNQVDPDIVGGKALLGIRVPTIVASPWSTSHKNHPRVVSQVFDHTSILKLIEWRFRLQPLTARDASNDVGNLVEALDFKWFNPRAPTLPLPPDPSPSICLP